MRYVEQDRSINSFFINERGERAFKLPPDCYRVRSFSEGLAAFNLDMDFKWGFVDREGTVVIEPKYDKVDYFRDGVACVSVNMKEDSQTGELYDGDWGYVDKTGREIVKPQFSQAQGFSDGLAWVHFAGSTDATYVDKSGKVVLRVARERVRFGPTPFCEGLAGFRATKEAGYGFIDKTGKFVIEPRFASVESFSEGHAAVVLQTGPGQYKYGYIDRTGRLVVDAKYDGASRFTEGRAAVRLGKFWGIINRRGDYVVKPGESPKGGTEPINEVLDFRGGLTYVHVGGEHEPDQFGEADPYGDWVGGAWYYMDRDGQIIRRFCKDWEGNPYW